MLAIPIIAGEAKSRKEKNRKRFKEKPNPAI
jgi:hypothetical protein